MTTICQPPPGDFSRCRSCNETVRWVVTEHAKLMPLDVDPCPDGNMVFTEEDREAGPVHALTAEELAGPATRYRYKCLAARVGRSVKYVYDRVKLLGLRKEVKDVFSDGEITAGHAILLARLKPDEQKRALEGGLFTGERYLFDPEDRRAKDPRKPVSVRELQCWIDEHVRFDQAEPDPMLFPETALALDQAKKIVPITHNHYVREEAREGRTFGPQSWRRADGKGGSKRCELAVTGIIVVGPGRGDALDVCVNKEKCKTHWGAAQRAKKRRALSGTTSASQERWKKEEEKRKAAYAQERAEEARWTKAAPAIINTIAAEVDKASTSSQGPLGQLLVKWCAPYRGHGPKDVLVPRGKTADDLVRHLAFLVIVQSCRDGWNMRRELPERAKHLGLDIAKIVEPGQ